MNELKEPADQEPEVAKIEADVIYDYEALAKMTPEEVDRLMRERKLPVKPNPE